MTYFSSGVFSRSIFSTSGRFCALYRFVKLARMSCSVISGFSRLFPTTRLIPDSFISTDTTTRDVPQIMKDGQCGKYPKFLRVTKFGRSCAENCRFRRQTSKRTIKDLWRFVHVPYPQNPKNAMDKARKYAIIFRLQ